MELMHRKELWSRGLRYRKNVTKKQLNQGYGRGLGSAWAGPFSSATLPYNFIIYEYFDKIKVDSN